MTILPVCGFDPGRVAKISKLKCIIKFFPYFSTTQIYYQMIEELNADATIFAIFTYSSVLLNFLYFENSPFYTLKVTFFIKVV